MSNSILSQLSCPNCNAPLDIHNASTQTIVCKSCQAYVAVGAGDASVLSQAARFKPGTPIEIGTTATLDGTSFFVMGHVQYEGWDPKDISDRWKWDEYLLGGADGRMLWLSHDEKGFGLYTRQRLTGEFAIRTSRAIPLRDGSKVAVHERYPAKIVGARGELTWRARPEDSLHMAEGAAHGKRYSVQQSDDELEIYEGQSIDELTIARAFGDEAWIQRIESGKSRKEVWRLVGIFCMIFAVASLLMAVIVNGGGEQVLRETFRIQQPEDEFRFDVQFDQVNRPVIVSLQIPSLPANTATPTLVSADFEVNITSPNEVVTDLFEQSLWRETGRDSDGPWDEWEYEVSNMFVPTVSGLHILEILFDDESSAPLPLDVTLTVRRNHITPLWLIVYAVAVGLVGVLALFRSAV